MPLFSLLHSLNGYTAKAGTYDTLLFSPKTSITAEPPTIAQAGLGNTNYNQFPGDELVFNGPFTYASPTLGFHKIEFIMDTGKISFETVGEKNFQAIHYKMSGSIVNANSIYVRELIKTLYELNTDGFIFAVQERHNEDWAILGSVRYGAHIKFKGDGGQKAGDSTTAEFEITYEEGVPYKTMGAGFPFQFAR